MAAAEGTLDVYPVMLGGLCGLTSWLLRMPAPDTLCCLKMRPAGELSRDECGDAAVEGEREVDSDSDPLLSGPEPRGICTMRADGCAGWRSLGCCVSCALALVLVLYRAFCEIEVTLFVLFSSVLFAVWPAVGRAGAAAACKL